MSVSYDVNLQVGQGTWAQMVLLKSESCGRCAFSTINNENANVGNYSVNITLYNNVLNFSIKSANLSVFNYVTEIAEEDYEIYIGAFVNGALHIDFDNFYVNDSWYPIVEEIIEEEQEEVVEDNQTEIIEPEQPTQPSNNGGGSSGGGGGGGGGSSTPEPKVEIKVVIKEPKIYPDCSSVGDCSDGEVCRWKRGVQSIYNQCQIVPEKEDLDGERVDSLVGRPERGSSLAEKVERFSKQTTIFIKKMWDWIIFWR